jgi:hypothetical protein
VPGAIVQGVIGGDINNKFERLDLLAGQSPVVGDGVDGVGP